MRPRAELTASRPIRRIGSDSVRAVLIVNPNATSTTAAGRDLLAHALRLSHTRIQRRYDAEVQTPVAADALKGILLDNLPLDEQRDVAFASQQRFQPVDEAHRRIHCAAPFGHCPAGASDQLGQA